MSKHLLSILAIYLLCYSLSADDIIAQIDNEVLTRTDNLPVETLAGASDSYLEGYIQALIDVHYYEYQVAVIVKDHKVQLANLPHNDLLAKSIIAFVKDLPGVAEVEVVHLSKKELERTKQYVEQPRVGGVWFPQSTILFAPLVADPRQPVTPRRLGWAIKSLAILSLPFHLGMISPYFAG